MNKQELSLFFIFLLICIAPNCGNGVLIIIQIIILILSIYIKPTKYITHPIIILLIPITIGIIHGIFKYPFYNVFKDMYYFFNPIAYLCLGAIITKSFRIKNILSAFAIAGTFLSIYFILYTAKNGGAAAFQDPRLYREYTGSQRLTTYTGYYEISTIATLVLFCCMYIYHIPLFKKRTMSIICLFINIIAIYLSASRSDMLIIFISLFILLSIKYNQYKHILFLYLFLLLFLGGFIMSFKSSTLVKDILRSPNEINIKPAANAKEIAANYRGHEAYMTMRTFQRSSSNNKLFGLGFGAKANIGRNAPVQYIVFMHNGYPYILLKSGLFGLICCLAFGYSLLRPSLKKNTINNLHNDNVYLFLKHLPIALIPSLYIANISIASLFNFISVILWTLCGIAIQYKFSLKKFKQ